MCWLRVLILRVLKRLLVEGVGGVAGVLKGVEMDSVFPTLSTNTFKTNTLNQQLFQHPRPTAFSTPSANTLRRPTPSTNTLIFQHPQPTAFSTPSKSAPLTNTLNNTLDQHPRPTPSTNTFKTNTLNQQLFQHPRPTAFSTPQPLSQKLL